MPILLIKKTFKCLSKVSEAVSEKYDLDEVEIVPKMKSMLVDSASMQQSLSVDDVAAGFIFFSFSTGRF